MVKIKKKNISSQINSFLKRLFPINRSITGKGNRETLKILNEIVPVKTIEYPSGSNIYDWRIPEEWQVNNAWIKDSKGNTIVDFKNNNLHLISYSKPIKKNIKFSDLKKNLYYDKKLPNAIPYRTSYYKKDWGFCLAYNDFKKIKKTDLFEVYIDSKFKPNGSLTVGEILVPGKSKEEILISTYYCHPSMANDNLSGALMTAFLAKNIIQRKNLQYSYRFIWVPETIGAIAYCAMNENILKKISIGLVITTVGGKGRFSYKKSWDETNPINYLVEKTFKQLKKDFITYPFDIHGSDERQFSSIGFRMNTISISKDKYYEYPEYHTSLDNLNIVLGKNINESLRVYIKLIDNLEKRVLYKSTNIYCETMLSKHNLYPSKGGAIKPNKQKKNKLDIILWLLFLSDGRLSTCEISKKLNVELKLINRYYLELKNKGLVKKI